MKRYSVVLFDADETLLDFRRAERDALHLAFTQAGLPEDDAFMQTYHRINDALWAQYNRGEIAQQTITDERFTRLFRQYGIGLDGRAFNEFYIDRLSLFAYTLPGAESLCRTLHAQGVRLYIATNGIERVQRSRYERSGLAAWMQGIFISSAIGARKPEKLFFDRVLHALDNPPRGEVLMVGDSPTADIQGALNAGIDACFVDKTGGRIAPDATYRVRSLAELEQMMTGSTAQG